MAALSDTASGTSPIEPFVVSIPENMVKDLRRRLLATRFSSRETVPDWSQGVPLSTLQDLTTYWATSYDTSRLQRSLGQYPQYTTTISSLTIHFLHIPSPHPSAIPLLLLHGWPGSILEYLDVIESLKNPSDPSLQPFSLVIPSLPGYGFSSAPDKPGIDTNACATLFTTLMSRLGYANSPTGYIVSGGDFGADIAAAMGHSRALDASASPGLKGVHLTSAFFDARAENLRTETDGKEISPTARKAEELQEAWEAREDAYFKQQATRPQTLGYAMSDSPAGLLAWMYEKTILWAEHGEFISSSDSAQPGRWSVQPLSTDVILDNVFLYWATNCITSSMRMYYETQVDNTALRIPSCIAVGVSLFPHDMSGADRLWGERYYENLVGWEVMERGGHFGAWEQPDLWVKSLRGFVPNAKIGT